VSVVKVALTSNKGNDGTTVNSRARNECVYEETRARAEKNDYKNRCMLPGSHGDERFDRKRWWV